MNVHVVRHRTQQADFVHYPTESWEMLTNPDPIDICIRRLELTPDQIGGIGLHVPQINMAGAAKEKHKDATVTLSSFVVRGRPLQSPKLCQTRIRQPEDAQTSGHEQGSTIQRSGKPHRSFTSS
jgi:hypothetical protein